MKATNKVELRNIIQKLDNLVENEFTGDASRTTLHQLVNGNVIVSYVVSNRGGSIRPLRLDIDLDFNRDEIRIWISGSDERYLDLEPTFKEILDNLNK